MVILIAILESQSDWITPKAQISIGSLSDSLDAWVSSKAFFKALQPLLTRVSAPWKCRLFTILDIGRIHLEYEHTRVPLWRIQHRDAVFRESHLHLTSPNALMPSTNKSRKTNKESNPQHRLLIKNTTIIWSGGRVGKTERDSKGRIAFHYNSQGPPNRGTFAHRTSGERTLAICGKGMDDPLAYEKALHKVFLSTHVRHKQAMQRRNRRWESRPSKSRIPSE